MLCKINFHLIIECFPLSNLLSVKVCPGHLVPCLRCVVDVLEVDEGEAAASAGVSVQHNLHPLQVTEPT